MSDQASSNGRVVDFSNVSVSDLELEIPMVSADLREGLDELVLEDGSVVVVGEDDLDATGSMASDEYRREIAHSQRLGIHAANVLKTYAWWDTYQAVHQTIDRDRLDDTERDQKMDLVRALWTALDAMEVRHLGGFRRAERGIYGFDPWWSHEVGAALASGAMFSAAYARSLLARTEEYVAFWGTTETEAATEAAALDVCRALFALIIAADTQLAPELGLE